MDAKEYLKNIQVLVISGGSGTRLVHRTGPNFPKALVEIKGRTLLEYCLTPFTDAGCMDFKFLLGVGGERVREFVESKKPVSNASFFIEKEKLGKGGAIKNALLNGVIDKSKPSITVFPDDLFLDRELPGKLAEAHLRGMELGCKSSVICIEKTKYAYGWVVCDERGLVTHFEEKPWLPYPANSGIFLFEPEIYGLIEKMIDMKKIPVEFENAVVPEMVRQKLLYTITIPFGDWIPVNDEKEYQNAEKALEKNRLP